MNLEVNVWCLAIDTKKENDEKWYVYLNGGRIKTQYSQHTIGQNGHWLGRR